MKHSFSKAEALRFGWRTVKKHVWFFVILILIANGISLLLSFLPNYLLPSAFRSNPLITVLILVIHYIISLEINFAVLAIYLKFVDKKKAEIKDLFSYFNARVLFGYFVASTLLSLLIFVGFIFLIVPGIYFALKYWFVPYAYVDKRSGILESFKISARLTKGVKCQLFLLGILQLLIMVGGFLALLVGLFIAVPINYLSDFYVYRKLQAQE